MKHELTDTTFLVLVRLDTVERLENILTSTAFLMSKFNTNIKVLECSSYNSGLLSKLLNRKINYSFSEDYDPILYRTRYLNQMIRETTTPFVSVWDTDVIAPQHQIIEAVEFLRKGEADFSYPYNNSFLDTSEIIRNLYFGKNNNIRILLKNRKLMKELYPPNPVGGAFFCNIKAYIESGLENEYFYGWGVEDGERFNRWMKLDYKIKRAEGPLFHLTHPRGINSLIHHPDQSLIKLKGLASTMQLKNKDFFNKKNA